MLSKAAERATPEAQLLTKIVLLVFRVNGQLLAAGPARVISSVLAIALVGVALVRYRPRRGRPVDR